MEKFVSRNLRSSSFPYGNAKCGEIFLEKKKEIWKNKKKNKTGSETGNPAAEESG